MQDPTIELKVSIQDYDGFNPSDPERHMFVLFACDSALIKQIRYHKSSTGWTTTCSDPRILSLDGSVIGRTANGLPDQELIRFLDSLTT